MAPTNNINMGPVNNSVNHDDLFLKLLSFFAAPFTIFQNQ